jgi:DNA-binding XRE family transcriptional regulator
MGEYSFTIADGVYAIACGNQQIASAFSRDTAEKITAALNAMEEGPRTFSLTNRLKEWRLRCGLTQAQLADLVGVNQATIGRYEAARLGLDLEILEKISNALQVDPSLLISNHGAKT